MISLSTSTFVFLLASCFYLGHARRVQVGLLRSPEASDAQGLKEPGPGREKLLALATLFSAFDSPRFPTRPSIHRSRLPPQTRAGTISSLHELRGGEGQIVIVRLRTKEGMKRVSLPATSTLLELKKMLQKQEKYSTKRQQISSDKKQFSEEDDAKTLVELGIGHGVVLQLDLIPATSAGSNSSVPMEKERRSTTSSAEFEQPRSRRKRSQTMTELSDKQAANDIVLQAPEPAKCQFISVEPEAGMAFANFVLDNEFEEYRMAMMFGHTGKDGGKQGVYVDAFYEPPQVCTSQSMSFENGPEAEADLARAFEVAQAIGLEFVGFAYAHPPRLNNTIEVPELIEIAKAKQIASSWPFTNETFVGMRFRAVLEDEDIDGDVTAEVYQPTLQALDLANKDVLLQHASGESGQVALTASSGLNFKIGSDREQAADMSYFVSRVHDMGRPYQPPPIGKLRNSFPVANRGLPAFRRFHLRRFLERQREAGLPFAQTLHDFQFLLYLTGVLPREKFDLLCPSLKVLSASAGRKKRQEAQAAVVDVEHWLRSYVEQNEAEATDSSRRANP